MRIDVWSDVVCPWCYIGKRRLEKALDGFAHADEVEVVWRSYQLDPGAPQVPTENAVESLAKKYGGGMDGARQMMDQVEAVAAEEGLLYRLSQTLRVNTVDAHRLLHLALHAHGPVVQGQLKEALLAAYFVEVRNVADHDTLTRIA
ncbi:MAG: DsbA family oxidoreductase, partial [Nocardioides sp.]|nr:DsbA family oxidoreductase [Nocardioides sp.]